MLNKIKNWSILVKIFSVFAMLIPSAYVYGAGVGINIGPNQAVTLLTVEQIIKDLVCWITRIGFLLLIIFILIAGIRMASSGSNADSFKDGLKAFKNVLWGGLVILGVGVIISTIGYILGVPFIIPVFCTPWGSF